MIIRVALAAASAYLVAAAVACVGCIAFLPRLDEVEW